MENSETVEQGVDLLRALDKDEFTLADIMDRIETITTNPAISRSILDTAETRGVIEREGALIRVTTGSGISIQHDVVRRDGEFTCQRCGASLSTGCFIPLDAGELGPFGPTCVEFVLETSAGKEQLRME